MPRQRFCLSIERREYKEKKKGEKRKREKKEEREREKKGVRTSDNFFGKHEFVRED